MLASHASVTRKWCSSQACSQRIPRHLVPEQHGMRRLHPHVCVRRCRVVKRHEYGPGGLHDEGTDGVSSIGSEDQRGCSTSQHHPHCRRRNASVARKCRSCRRSTSSWKITSSRLTPQTFPFRGDPFAKLQEAEGGLAASPRKPRVPHCKERPSAHESRENTVARRRKGKQKHGKSIRIAR